MAPHFVSLRAGIWGQFPWIFLQLILLRSTSSKALSFADLRGQDLNACGSQTNKFKHQLQK